MEKDWSKFDQENVILDYLSADWEDLMKSANGNVDQTFASFAINFSSILDMYTPLEKFSEQKLYFRNKSWINLGLKNVFLINNYLFTKYIKKHKN